jgi:hypothetical protein
MRLFVSCVLFFSGLALSSFSASQVNENPDLEARRLRLYQDGLRIMLRETTNDNNRPFHIEEFLERLRGDAAQTLRLLFWATEPESSFRVEIMTQWLLDEDPLPAKQELKRKLRNLLRRHKDVAIRIRFLEIDQMYETIESEREKRKQRYETPYFSSNVSSMTALDEVTEDMLFSPNPQVRREAYRNLEYLVLDRPTPEPYDFLTGVFDLLWVLEPNDEAAVELMKRKLGAIGGADEVSGDRFEYVTQEFREEEKIKTPKSKISTRQQLKRAPHKVREPKRRVKLSPHHARIFMGAWLNRGAPPPMSIQDPNHNVSPAVLPDLVVAFDLPWSGSN